MKLKNLKLAIIGLGYVGLPLAVEFAKKRVTIGFDIDKKRIKELKSGLDKTLEQTKKQIKNAKKLKLTSCKKDLQSANCYIVTVPTPIDELKKPDLKYIYMACEIIGNVIKANDIIIFESTVYPGCTEEVCVPILEKKSGLKYNQDFFCGYSPERINPGDKKHRIDNIKKITSGSTSEIANLIDKLYNEIIVAGTHKATSIKVAEAAKIIENTQRDLNIALINELSIIFNKMDIDTEEILKAAGTKWNFLNFKPGLVGGHCIGIDPYYLTHKAESVGYQPEIILAGRKLNDSMGIYVASQFIKAMSKKTIKIKNAKILIMGLSFKENCADLRNSGIASVIKKLRQLKCNLDLHDPWADSNEIKKLYNINPIKSLNLNTYDGIIISIGHSQFKDMGIKSIKALGKKNFILYDLKHIFSKQEVDLRL